MLVIRCKVNGMEQCPHCYANAKGRSNYPGHAHYRQPRGDEAVSRFKSKPATEGVPHGSKPGLPPPDSELAKECPTVWEYLATDRYEDGSARKTSTLSLFVGPGGLQASLNDRERGLVCFVTGTSVPAILFTLEDMLFSDKVDWRRARSGRNDA